jgi:hypothetical protein
MHKEHGLIRHVKDPLCAEILNTIYLNYLMMIDPMFVFRNKQRTEQYAEKMLERILRWGDDIEPMRKHAYPLW